MRELFDETAGQSPLDPNEAVRRSSARAAQRKRFYTGANVVETPDGFAVTLDDKPIRTPARHTLAAPSRALAEVIAQEWEAQRDIIDPTTMPMTRLANSVIDGVADRVQEVLNDIARYFESDLLFYRASHPAALVERQAQNWDKVLFWAAECLGAHFILTEGVMHVTQPAQAVAAARGALPTDAWPAAAMHMVTTITGSAVLALALIHQAADAPSVWAAAHVDEDWNIEKWGADEEVTARRAQSRLNFDAAVAVLADRRMRQG